MAISKSAIEMSDEELNRSVNRLRQESEYNRLVNSKSTKNGWEIAKNIMVGAGTVALFMTNSAKIIKSGKAISELLLKHK